MKNKIFGAVIFLSGLLALYHYSTMICNSDYSSCTSITNSPLDLLLGTLILLIIGAGVGLKVIKVNA